MRPIVIFARLSLPHKIRQLAPQAQTRTARSAHITGKHTLFHTESFLLAVYFFDFTVFIIDDCFADGYISPRRIRLCLKKTAASCSDKPDNDLIQRSLLHSKTRACSCVTGFTICDGCCAVSNMRESLGLALMSLFLF